MSITVLGTVFNVKSHPDDQTDLVEVKEGKVQVDMPEAMMRISAGEHATINKVLGSYSKEKDSIQNLLFGIPAVFALIQLRFKMLLRSWSGFIIARLYLWGISPMRI